MQKGTKAGLGQSHGDYTTIDNSIPDSHHQGRIEIEETLLHSCFIFS